MYDAQGCIVQSNPAFHEMLGLSADPDYSARRYPERVAHLHARDQHGQPILYEQMLLTRALRGEVIPAEKAPDTTVTTRDGREVTLSRSAASIRDADGKIIGAVIVPRDVTARRQLERQVEEQASQLEAIFEAQADGVVLFDRHRRLVRANRAWRDILQRYAEMAGLTADPTYVALPLADQAEQLTLWDVHGRVIPHEETPTARALRGETVIGANAVDERVQSPDGRVLQVSVSAAPVRDAAVRALRSEEHTSELQSHSDIVCRLLLEKKRSDISCNFIHQSLLPAQAHHLDAKRHVPLEVVEVYHDLVVAYLTRKSLKELSYAHAYHP